MVDLVCIRGVASSFARVDGALSAEPGMEDRGVSLNSAEIEGVVAVEVTRGKDEVPAELLLVAQE